MTIEKLREVEAETRQHWKWGNLTRLGVCNMLTRGGFNQDSAIRKSYEICGPVLPTENYQRSYEDIEFLWGQLQRIEHAQDHEAIKKIGQRYGWGL